MKYKVGDIVIINKVKNYEMFDEYIGEIGKITYVKEKPILQYYVKFKNQDYPFYELQLRKKYNVDDKLGAIFNEV